MAVQGKRFSEEAIARIQYLLAKTDMAIPDIARRMDCSNVLVHTVNRRFDIRRYNGKKANWLVTQISN